MVTDFYYGLNIDRLPLTRHASIDRKERFDRMLEITGSLGKVIKSVEQDIGTIRHLTDKGVLVITDPNCEVIVTAWFPFLSQVKPFFPGEGHTIPPNIAYKVEYHLEEQEALRLALTEEDAVA